jgi:C1A family cysteine protease
MNPTLTPHGRGLGYTGSFPVSIRTKSFDLVRPKFTLKQAPRSKYLWCPPTRDQGNLGACISFAWTYHMTANQMQQFRRLGPGGTPQAPLIFSPLEIYYDYRNKIEHDVWDDTGAGLMAVGTLITQDGVCLESLWPYDIAEFAVAPPAAAMAEAQANKLASVHPLNTLEDMILCMASNYGFVVGVSVYQSFEDAWEKDGNIPLPGTNDKLLGGHGLNIGMGYDMDYPTPWGKGVFYGQNSWGFSGGLPMKKGFFRIPFQYLEDPDLVLEIGTGR